MREVWARAYAREKELRRIHQLLVRDFLLPIVVPLVPIEIVVPHTRLVECAFAADAYRLPRRGRIKFDFVDLFDLVICFHRESKPKAHFTTGHTPSAYHLAQALLLCGVFLGKGDYRIHIVCRRNFIPPSHATLRANVYQNVFTHCAFHRNRLHHSLARFLPIAGSHVYMLAPEAFWTVIRIPGAMNVYFAMITDKIFNATCKAHIGSRAAPLDAMLSNGAKSSTFLVNAM